MAPRASSASSSCAVGGPFQNRNPSISDAPSMCGIPNFRTAGVPSAHTTGATHEHVTFECSNGGPRRSDQRRVKSSSIAGKVSSHACRSEDLPQFAMSCLGRIIPPLARPRISFILNSALFRTCGEATAVVVLPSHLFIVDRDEAWILEDPRGHLVK